ncbi:hypothetical protein [Sorangium sp. So ce426]|uniref:hypothetical protein n=1 Tax=Sorangium sp. So ce426 TaxID=3133312 RepID=UPI003F5C38E0
MRRELQAGWLAMSVLLGSTAATGNARGEERAKPPSGEVNARDLAVRDFEEGRRAHVEGRLEEAELSYLRAWSRLKSFDIAVNLGQVQLRLNKPASAAKHLAYGVRTVRPEIEPERLGRMLALLDEAKAQVGAVRLQGTDVADVEVLVDGERVPAEEVKHEIYVEPGEHRIVIRRAGYEETAIRVVAAAGVRETVPVAMKPLEVKAPEAKTPEASEAGPAKLPEAPMVAPPAGRAEERAGGPRRAVLIGGAVTAGAAAVAGVVFTVLAVTKGSDAEELRDSVVRNHGDAACSRTNAPSAACAGVKGAFDVHRRWTNAAFWSFVGAGAAGAGTLIYGFSTKPSRPHGRVLVTPLVGADSVGISVAGVL